MKYLKLFEDYKKGFSKEKDYVDTLHHLGWDPTEQEIYNSIEMMMRPGEYTLSYDEISDIANENNVDIEKVHYIMTSYLADRADEYHNELPEAVEDCLKYIVEEEKIELENIEWNIFWKWFDGSWFENLVEKHTKEEIKSEFNKQKNPKDPNQLEIPLEENINENKGRCHSCEIMNINGIRTHERGCPDEWMDEKRECKWCGTEFKPEERNQEFCCDSCEEDYNT